MKIHDITLLMQEGMTTYNGEPGPKIERTAELEKDGYTLSFVSFGSHTGTHIDAPIHFIPGGVGVDALPLEAMIGPVIVRHLPDVDAITLEELAQIGLPEGTERVLFKTRNSQHWANPKGEFVKNFVYLAPDACHWLVERGVRLVGIDYLSVEQFEPANHDTHTILLAAGIVVIEGLNLREIVPGAYTLIALPLKLKDGDGGAARVVLVEGRIS